MKMNLSDEVLAAVAQAVQLGILTGTDVVDHLRLLELEQSVDHPTSLVLTVDSKKRIERNVNDMLERSLQIKREADASANGGDNDGAGNSN